MRRTQLALQLNLGRVGKRGGVTYGDAFAQVSERPLHDADLMYSALSPVHTSFKSRTPDNKARRSRQRALENVQIQMARNNLGVKY
jgi:hypothetical protein